MAKCALAAALMLACAKLFAQPSQPDVSLEYAVKATYLYKLAPFVNWPPGTFESPSAPFEICVLGPDPFHDFLERSVAGRWLGTHPLKIRRLSTAKPGDDCQIVFIGSMRANKLREALQDFTGKPVLTVTDSADPGSSGSIVQFVMDDGHVRFEIDNDAALHNHLTISSKLLDLALAVKGAQ
ncbi:MAG: YfiR family protein [Rhodanobacteraceae bacterium]